MTKILLCFLALLCFQTVFSQCTLNSETATLGIGLLECSSKNSNDGFPIFEVFDDDQLTQKFCAWNYYADNNAPFCAKVHKPDYGRVRVVVIDSTNNAYKVIVNNEDIKYVPRTYKYSFKSWNKYLLESTGARRKIESVELRNQPIRSNPEDSASEIVFPNKKLEHLCILNVKNDWVKIALNCKFYNEQISMLDLPCEQLIDKCDNQIGWLKWRQNNMILIDIFTGH